MVEYNCTEMAYQKVDQRFRVHTQDQDAEELPVTSLELEWDMEKELEESGFDGFEPDNSGQHHLGNSAGNTDLDFEFMQPSASPRGRFARLEEESDYVPHTRPGPKNQQGSFSKMAKLFVAGFIIFICGFLIGYYGRKSSSKNILSNNATTPTPPVSSTAESDDGNILQNIVQAIEGYSIRNFFRNLTPFAAESDWGSSATHVMEQWTASGLTEIRLANYTVLLSLPDTDQNKIILTNSSQCFYPSGQQCSTLHSAPRGKKEKNDLYFYAAYSAKGSLEAEIIDVQYGTINDLVRLQSSTNVTKKIALIKLGKAPLLYKLSLLLEVGFGGALVYIDPCDSPQKEKIGDETFWISLNPGGDPSTPGYPSIGGGFREHGTNITSLLVQPIAASLAKALLSSTEKANGNGCFHFTNSSAVSKTVRLEVGAVSEYRTIQNVIGYLKGSINPDKYVIVGSHHGNNEELWTSSTSIITEIIKTMMAQVQKRRWRPNRSIVFCSWGGSTFGNIGSYEWAEEMKRVLQSNAVAYINLFKPIVGNGTLKTVVSPSLRQLATDLINMRFSLNCTSQENCSGRKINSVQVEGNSDFFINHLGVPTVQFAYQETKTSMGPGFLSEALLIHDASMVEALDPSFNLHETIAKLTAEMILRIANEPVLPYSVLDVALEVQEQLKDGSVASDQMLALANALRETAQLFQSDEMRPANDPKERDPAHLRMLNDVLQNLEKNFLIQRAPPGYYRNILYHLDETSNQFSVMKEAVNHCRLQQTNQTLSTVSSMVMNSIRSAQVYLKAGLDVFENIQSTKRTN
ncbi:inactive N-acetylated-alpha-linked acidic dipeptidase-like protein 2 isoform X1 [Carcharodon carcharias]|uniref:inactive N-acetylated-alpha-linked acidic dipeptidase-like protein 2 isoform X1 n=2 Tax=Carcharodon carcharias TaxID=13397 RepID=UPI001B7DA3A4|nr:inactive N-acetylated-alpha-linked acidic dipeptidase-like protein 2 isoform X1 [Carcharodon carcharias]XP_041066825.1 inactive N-acetylated-alpha-linked acidic dipeptidase-like protein 2 isoform X1 [Carcharodon carcharias]XP_041066832.1 inactive N-acetylated-alpha-linked acidic dipeptidase-like protein 2 isoform X1 [Carcharodon carcharias]